jgi:hypothetical protein
MAFNRNQDKAISSPLRRYSPLEQGNVRSQDGFFINQNQEDCAIHSAVTPLRVKLLRNPSKDDHLALMGRILRHQLDEAASAAGCLKFKVILSSNGGWKP